MEISDQRSESFRTFGDAVPHDLHVVIPIGSGLLVPEAESVQELVLDGGDAVAVGPDGEPLRPHAPVPHRGEAAKEKGGKKHNIYIDFYHIFYLFSDNI